jgi:hypothetical protein
MSIRKEEGDIWIMLPSRLHPGGQNTKWGTLRIGIPPRNSQPSIPFDVSRQDGAVGFYQSTKHGLGSRRIT